MARPTPHSQEAWTKEGREAIVDLVQDRLVAPWAEIESRICHGPWKDFHQVQPVQLNGARQQLRNEDPLVVIEETSEQEDHPVTTVRVPFNGNKRLIERLRGSKRKIFRKYLKWTNDQALCGHHAESVILESLHAAAPKGGLWVPGQTTGEVGELDGIEIEPGPLDALAYILDTDTVQRKSALLVEVKNLRSWVYPWAPELWQLLVKVAPLAQITPVSAMLAAPHAAWQTMQFAKDVGFLVSQYGQQLFNPKIDEDEFEEIVDGFGLTILRHEGPLKGVTTFVEKFLRVGPVGFDPEDEGREWCDQQAQRLSIAGQAILEFADLAEDLDGGTRRALYYDFRDRLAEIADWELVGGY
jgi:hypothetical protein